MNSAQLAQIIDQLDALSKEALTRGHMSMHLDYRDALLQLQAWQQSGMAGPIPVDLGRLGIPVPEEAETPAAQPTSTLEDQQEAHRLLAEALEALGEDDLPGEALAAAVRDLEAAQAKGSGDVSHQAGLHLAQARARLKDEVNALLSQAHADQQAGRLAEAEEAYRKALQLDPQNREVSQNLGHISQRRYEAVQQSGLEQVRRLIEAPNPQRALSDVEDGIRQAEALLGSVQDAQIIAEVQRLRDQGAQKRADILNQVGAVETMAAAENYDGAIQEYERLIASGTLEIEIDGQKQSTAERLQRLRDEYAAFCHTKASKYYDEAERFLPGTPKAAARRLQQALDTFGAMPEEDRMRLQDRREQVEEMIERWDRASGLVQEAIDAATLAERLTLLLQAQDAYGDYPSLADRIAEARAAVASQIYGEVEDLYHRARSALEGRREYEAAEELCMQARSRSRDVASATPELSALVGDVDALLETVRRRQARAGDLNALADAVEAALGRDEYDIADGMLQRLPEDDRREPRLQELMDRLARREGITGVYNRALLYYQEGNWAQAKRLCDEVINDSSVRGAIDPRVQELRAQVVGQQTFQEALRLRDAGDLQGARAAFERAASQNESLRANCEQYIQGINALEAQARDVQVWIRRARSYVPVGDPGWQDGAYGDDDFERALAEYERARGVPSAFQQEILEQWKALRDEWRERLLARAEDNVSASPPRYGEAYQAISTLEGHELLRREDRDLSLEVKSQQAARYEAAAQWTQAEQLWAEVIRLRPLEPAYRQGLQRVRREVAVAEAERILSGGDLDGAIDALDEALRDEFTRSDPAILSKAIDICLAHKRFEQAERYRDVLAISLGEDHAQVIQLSEQIAERQIVTHALEESKRLFDEGDYERAVEVLQQCEETCQDLGVSRLRRQREREATQKLLAEARARRQGSSSAGLAEVIYTYQRVLRFDGTNREATSQIEAQRQSLPTLINGLVQQAMRFDIGTRYPADAVREAEDLIKRLESFREVVQYADEPARLGRSISQGLERLGNACNDLRGLVAAMDRAREALDEPTNDRQITQALQGLTRAATVAPAVGEVQELLQELRDVAAQRADVRDLLQQLRSAMSDNEDPAAFDQVQELGRQILEIDPEDRFGLQASGTTYYDQILDSDISDVEEFRQIARERKVNYERCLNWYQGALEQYQDVMEQWQEIESKREERNLDERVRACHTCLTAIEVATSYLNSGHPEEPQSWLARDLLEGATRPDGQQVLGAQQMREQIANIERTLCREQQVGEEDREHLRELLIRIAIHRRRLHAKSFLGRSTVSLAVLRALEGDLLEAEAIDPNSEQVAAARKEWQEARDQTQS